MVHARPHAGAREVGVLGAARVDGAAVDAGDDAEEVLQCPVAPGSGPEELDRIDGWS